MCVPNAASRSRLKPICSISCDPRSFRSIAKGSSTAAASYAMSE